MKITGEAALLLAYGAASIFVFLAGAVQPEYNWDIIPYIACAKSLQTDDPAQIHSFAYSEIEKSEGTRMYAMPGSKWDTPYRALMRDSDAAFARQLPFYRIRAVYILLIYLFYAAGGSIIFATHFISALAAFAAAWIIFLIARRWFARPYQYGILPVAFALGMLEVARLSTPDALALLIIMSAVAGFLSGSVLFYFTVPLMIFVRSDLLILAILFCLSALFVPGFRRSFVWIAIISSIAAFAFLHWYFRYPGWAAVFRSTFLDRLPTASPPVVKPAEYAVALIKGSWNAVRNPQFLIFTVIVGFALRQARLGSTGGFLVVLMRSKESLLLLISVLYVAVRMVVFPLPDTRFFAGPFIVAAISLFAMLSGTFPMGGDARPEQTEHCEP